MSELKFNVPPTRGWSGGAMVLGKHPVLGRPTNLDYSRARAYCACRRRGWGCLDIFSLIYLFSFDSPSLWETARYRLKYCLKGLLSPKQPPNQPTHQQWEMGLKSHQKDRRSRESILRSLGWLSSMLNTNPLPLL